MLYSIVVENSPLCNGKFHVFWCYLYFCGGPILSAAYKKKISPAGEFLSERSERNQRIAGAATPVSPQAIRTAPDPCVLSHCLRNPCHQVRVPKPKPQPNAVGAVWRGGARKRRKGYPYLGVPSRADFDPTSSARAIEEQFFSFLRCR